MLDEYAEQQVIEFWKYCMKKGYKFTLAAREIYQQFLSEKTH
jgi:hypothetical protein